MVGCDRPWFFQKEHPAFSKPGAGVFQLGFPATNRWTWEEGQGDTIDPFGQNIHPAMMQVSEPYPCHGGQFCFIVFKSWPFEFFYRKVSDHLFMHFFPETPNDWCQTINKPYRWEVAVFILVFHGKKAGDVRGVAKDGCFWALKTDFCSQNAFNGALGILVSLDQGPLVSFSDTPPATTMYALIYSIYIFLCITVSRFIVYLVLVCK